MCSEFSLDRDIDVDELYEYLKNTNIPNTKEKYIEYFDTDFEYHEQWLAAYSPGLFSAGPRRAAGIKAVYDEIEQMKQKYGKMPQTFFFKVEAAGDVILDRNLIGSSAQAVKRKEAKQSSVIYLRSAFSAWNKFFEIGVSKSQAPQQDFQTFMVLPKRDISRMVFDKEKMCEYLFYQTKDTGWLFR
jgi:hypothetical protein